MPAIRRVILFGSLVQGVPTPRSDADLLVEVSESSHAEPRHRIPEALRAFQPLPCPLDLFVLTSAEIEKLRKEGSPLLRAALEGGQDLLPAQDDAAGGR
jgi:predicted nucleotidyltransferase